MVLAGLASVTKQDGEPYEEFVQRDVNNSLGRAVKIADMCDNCEMSRISDPSEADHARVSPNIKRPCVAFANSHNPDGAIRGVAS